MHKLFITILVFSFLFASCKKESKGIKLRFIDEYTLQDSLHFKNTLVGGLSGIDYDGEYFYFVVDDSNTPRVLKSNIKFANDTIQGITFKDVIIIKDSSEFFMENILDLESVIYNANKQEFHLVSEGFIKGNKSPSIFTISSEGKYVNTYAIPSYFKTEAKHNASFESSTRNIDNTGVWVAMESVLKSDGEEPGFSKTNSPVRITLFDTKTRLPIKQFVYQLDQFSKAKKGNINVNGVTAILEYRKNEFIVVERAYQSGYGSYGNTVKLYKVVINETTTNTLQKPKLKHLELMFAKKELLLNFNNITPFLTKGIIDNIEGITFGPLLSNGNKSLLLVSDDNFKKYDPQINQFILLEIID